MKVISILAASLVACGTVNSPTHDDTGSDAAGSDQPHAPGQLYGSIHDERGDSIDMSSGEPVHTHAGPLVDLGAADCPAVYKYAYLMDTQGPKFGRQTTTNPLQWQVTTDVASLDPGATGYRVRADDGRVLLDWTSITPDAHGVYAIELHRDQIPSLGIESGKRYVDVRFRDTAGSETVDTACWEHHPLAAPVAFAPIVPADLFAMSLPAHSWISSLVGGGDNVFATQIAQMTSEPVTLAFATNRPTGTYTKTYVDTFELDSSGAVTIACGDSPCDVNPAVPAGTTATDSAALDGYWSGVLYDSVTGAVACPDLSNCTLPGRTPTEAPHVYALSLRFSTQQILPPTSMTLSSFLGQYWVGSLEYTGVEPTDTFDRCTAQQARTLPLGQGIYYTCVAHEVYRRIVALDRVRFDFDAYSLAIHAKPDATSAPESLSYVPDSAIAIDAAKWDAGDAGL